MVSDRVQRQIDRLLDEAEAAISVSDWATVGDRARNVLRLDPENSDALSYLAAAERDTDGIQPIQASHGPRPASVPVPEQPASFANGRYQVKRFLGDLMERVLSRREILGA